MTAMEREYAAKLEELKSDYEKKIFKLQQENFALSAKVLIGSSSGEIIHLFIHSFIHSEDLCGASTR